MKTFSLTVLGNPVPQGSKRAFPIYRGRGDAKQFTGKTAVIDSAGSSLTEWRHSIVAEARRKWDGQGPMEGPLRVSMSFYLRRPKRPKHETPATRPDLSKLERAVEDALKTAGVYHDDGQIVHATVRKWYGDIPQVAVYVEEVG